MVGNGQIYGAIIGNNVNLSGNASCGLHYDESLRSLNPFATPPSYRIRSLVEVPAFTR